eukprot:1159543-Pelagomonas_calceolata.AAC.2
MTNTGSQLLCVQLLNCVGWTEPADGADHTFPGTRQPSNACHHKKLKRALHLDMADEALVLVTKQRNGEEQMKSRNHMQGGPCSATHAFSPTTYQQ